MSKRLWIATGLAAAVAALSGCVVVPTDPAYGGYGYGYGYATPAPAVTVAPPPVVVTPVPRRHHYWRPYGWYR